MRKAAALLFVIVVAAGCTKAVVKPSQSPCDCAEKSSNQKNASAIQLPAGKNPAEIKPEKTKLPEVGKATEYRFLKPAKWQDLDGLLKDNLVDAWPAWLQSCSVLIKKQQWKAVCIKANALKNPNNAKIVDYFTNDFNVYRATNKDGSKSGLVTGYYEPLLKGSRKKSAKYPYPLYRQPDNLITVDLSEAYPELKHKRVRGKLAGRKLVPYSTRAEIDANPSPLAGSELLWVDDIIDVFFLQIQGSGLVQLDNGKQAHVGYANHNGHAYSSIGRLLIKRGDLPASKASMQGIKNWARKNLDKLQALLNSNPSYVFFRELPAGLPGPLGALGVPITAERSVAVDKRFVPLGAPIFLSTTAPNSRKPLKRLMMAQDTGGAIKGGVRADFFWGAGKKAGKRAGSMKQTGKIWVLLPKEFKLAE